MPGITAEDVRNGYRLFLGREPESEAAIQWHLQAGDLDTLRSNFLASEEFQCGAAIIPVGLHLDNATFEVEVDAAPDQLAEMLRRTALAWRAFGETDPHWSVLTNPIFQADTIAETKKVFYQTGREQIARVGALLQRNGLDFPSTGRALDFGCGVGRLTLALAPHCESVIGVDVSLAHVRHAREEQASEGIGNALFQIIGDVQDVSMLPPFDMLLTLIVLQHNPPPVIKLLLDGLLSRLNRGGTAVFQVPTYKADYRFSANEYLAAPAATEMEMHPLPQKHIYDLLERHRCKPLEVREDTLAWDRRMVSQTFLVQKA